MKEACDILCHGYYHLYKVVTPSGLRAWARRVRAEARGGGGERVLGWYHKAVSAYTWCVTGKGPQRKWLHKIKKSECDCGPQEEKLASFFTSIHEFFVPANVPANVFAPVALPLVTLL